MLTPGNLNASQTERSRSFGTVAKRSIGRPLARRKSNWIAAATRRSSRNRSQTAEMSSLLSLKNCWTSTSDILEGRVSAPMRRWAKDTAGSSAAKSGCPYACNAAPSDGQMRLTGHRAQPSRLRIDGIEQCRNARFAQAPAIFASPPLPWSGDDQARLACLQSPHLVDVRGRSTLSTKPGESHG